MQTRRGFLRTLFGTAAAVATGGLGKVAEALTTKPAASKILNGFRGSSFLDAGYFYAPYISLRAPVVINLPPAPKDVFMRYARRAVKQEYYEGVILKDF